MLRVVLGRIGFLAGLGILLVANAAPVSAASYLNALVSRAKRENLAQDAQWLALVHYEHRLFGPGVVSLIDNPAFFAATDGKTEPQAELDATLAAFFEGADEADPDRHPQCTWIARYRWLKARLGFDPERLPEHPCDAFEEWYKRVDPAHITLVFPAAYLNNPSSMFGHTLLRIDRPNQDERTRLISYAVNFAADTGADQGLAFAVFGLTGGYRGYFSMRPYYEMVKMYSDIENRDIWEYELNFDKPEIDLMIEHLWELEDQYVDYYFFSTNCSYALLSLLDVARPSLRLTEGFSVYALPVDTVRAVVEQRGVLHKAIFRPSGRTRIDQYRRVLSRPMQRLALRLARGEIGPTAPPVSALEPVERARVLELAQSFLQYQLDTGGQPRGIIAPRLLNILRARASMEVKGATPRVAEPATRPDEGHRSARLGIGFGATHNRLFAELSLRPVYHDLLDPAGGYVDGAAIEALDISLRRYEGRRPNLESLTLVRVRSLTPRNELFQPISWHVGAGFERFRKSGKDLGTIVFSLETGVGPTWEPFDDVLVSGFLDAALFADGKWPTGRVFGAGPQVSVLWSISPRWNLELDGRWQEVLGGGRDSRFAAGVQLGFALGRNWAVRIGGGVENDGRGTFGQWSSSLNWYF
jgi:hypothetical protein